MNYCQSPAVETYNAIAAALPLVLDSSNVTVEPGISEVWSTIKTHDYAAGIVSAFGSVLSSLLNLLFAAMVNGAERFCEIQSIPGF